MQKMKTPHMIYWKSKGFFIKVELGEAKIEVWFENEEIKDKFKETVLPKLIEQLKEETGSENKKPFIIDGEEIETEA